MTNEQFLLGKHKDKDFYIEAFHTLFAGQTNLSGKTTTIIALVLEAIKKGYTVLLFDTKPTAREFEGYHEIPVCYQPTTDPLVLMGLLEAKRKARLSNLYATLGRICERAKTIDDVITNSKNMEARAKSGFIKDACYTLRDLLTRVNDELKSIKFSTRLELKLGTINIMPINKLSDEAQQLVLKTACEEILKDPRYNRFLIVGVDEAFKFFPQDYSSACKRAGLNIITQGAKTKLFMWISTQFLAVTDKDSMRACANKILGRQDHNLEIDATIKLIPGGRQAGKQYYDTIMGLHRGEFIFVPLDGKPTIVQVIPPWEREGRTVKQYVEDTRKPTLQEFADSLEGWSDGKLRDFNNKVADLNARFSKLEGA
jgi:hypothetical protein